MSYTNNIKTLTKVIIMKNKIKFGDLEAGDKFTDRSGEVWVKIEPLNIENIRNGYVGSAAMGDDGLAQAISGESNRSLFFGNNQLVRGVA